MLDSHKIRDEFFKSTHKVKRQKDSLPQEDSIEITLRRIRRTFNPGKIIRGNGYMLMKKSQA